MTQLHIFNRIFILIFMLIASSSTAEAQSHFGFSPSIRASAKASSKSRATARKRPSSDRFIRTELFFGTDRDEGPDVTEEDWNRFLADEITPRFPDGLTVLTGYGQFRNSSGQIIREASFVVVLLYPVEERSEKSVKIEEIRELYKECFQQESVLRVDYPHPVRLSFVGAGNLSESPDKPNLQIAANTRVISALRQ